MPLARYLGVGSDMLYLSAFHAALALTLADVDPDADPDADASMLRSYVYVKVSALRETAPSRNRRLDFKFFSPYGVWLCIVRRNPVVSESFMRTVRYAARDFFTLIRLGRSPPPGTWHQDST